MADFKTNRQVYKNDPSTRKLENQGVANVNDDRSAEQQTVLRYELETFVCNGQYADGLEKILASFVANIDKPEQPAVWVSGFYGSGKSHLVKMLRALWVNESFSNGDHARTIAKLPVRVSDLLKELDAAGSRVKGGVHAASGTLGAGANGLVRPALLSIIYKSLDLPEAHHEATFVLWLKREGKLNTVRELLAAAGRSFDEELANMFVSPPLHQALRQIFPDTFIENSDVGSLLLAAYPPREDVTNTELVEGFRKALTNEQKHFPLTLIVLDEVQQYIGNDETRSLAVQEAIETVSKRFEGRVLFVATGQAAISSTDKLNKLEGRFRVRVQLRDEDIDEVVRTVVLEKHNSATPRLNGIYDRNNGELSRHLAETKIGKQPNDQQDFPRDYPILPTRRRFWEHALRALDSTSVQSQLRNQLSLVHTVAISNLDEPLGHVAPADALFFDSAENLVQRRELPRNVYEFTLKHEHSSDADKRLTARAVGIVYLINRVQKDTEAANIGIKADIPTIADLLVVDIEQGADRLRAKLPRLISECDLLDEIDGEYVIRTEESARWRDAYLAERSRTLNDQIRLTSERNERLRSLISESLKNIRIKQGASQQTRNVVLETRSTEPPAASDQIVTWVPGWQVDRQDVLQAARAAGVDSAHIFVHLPAGSVDELNEAIADFLSTRHTLTTQQATNSAAGAEARASMESKHQAADTRINAILEQSLQRGEAFQGGGIEFQGIDLRSAVEQAAERSVDRLYPEFQIADHAHWGKVAEVARRGSPDALKAIGHAGEPADHRVVAQVRNFLQASKLGKEVRAHFTSPPFGWSDDAIDGALLALVQAGMVRAEENNRPIALKQLTRTEINKAKFVSETISVRTQHRLAVRGLYTELGLPAHNGDEATGLQAFYDQLAYLASQAGGEPPQPAPPNLGQYRDLANMSSSNERLVRTADAAADLRQLITQWRELVELSNTRLPLYKDLQALLRYAAQLPTSPEDEQLRDNAEALKMHRQLFDDGNPVERLLGDAESLLRPALHDFEQRYDAAHAQGTARFGESPYYAELTPEQRNEVLANERLTRQHRPSFARGSRQEILSTLAANDIDQLATTIDSLPTRFDKVMEASKKLAAPEAPQVSRVRLSRKELHTENDVDAWLQEAGKALKQQLAASGGPVRID